MLLQQSPFRGEDEDEIYDAILADEPLYPIHMPRDSVSILQKLLTREPEQRLGSGPTDAQEIMSQPFFRNISWDDVYHKRITPPFQPQITSATDTSNFDSEFTSVTPVLTPVQSGKSSITFYLIHFLITAQYYPRLCKKNSAVSHTLPTSFEQPTTMRRHHLANSTQAAPPLATRSQH
jgi:serine/threonine protein kinase